MAYFFGENILYNFLKRKIKKKKETIFGDFLKFLNF